MLTDILVPAPGASRSHYGKLRRRGAFDFPVLGVATRVDARRRLRGVGAHRAQRRRLVARAGDGRRGRCSWGNDSTRTSIRAAADLAFKPAKPLDNTDFENAWRKKMVKVYVRDGLRAVAKPRP